MHCLPLKLTGVEALAPGVLPPPVALVVALAAAQVVLAVVPGLHRITIGQA